MVSQDINDFINQGGGAPGARFESVGDSIDGVVMSARLQQQTDINTGTPKFFKSGDPMMELVVTLQTDERSDAIAEDTGLRTVYAKGAADRKGILDGIRTAVGREGLREGGRLWVKYTGNGVKANPAFSAPKQYAVKYQPPAVNLGPQGEDDADAPF